MKQTWQFDFLFLQNCLLTEATIRRKKFCLNNFVYRVYREPTPSPLQHILYSCTNIWKSTSLECCVRLSQIYSWLFSWRVNKYEDWCAPPTPSQIDGKQQQENKMKHIVECSLPAGASSLQATWSCTVCNRVWILHWTTTPNEASDFSIKPVYSWLDKFDGLVFVFKMLSFTLVWLNMLIVEAYFTPMKQMR